jgi:hypothetical protein
MEALLSNPDTRREHYPEIVDAISDLPTSLGEDLKVILNGYLGPHDRIAQRPTPEDDVGELNPKDFTEGPFDSFPLEKDPRTCVVKMQKSSPKYLSAGLSPNCRAAFLLRPDVVKVLALDDCGKVTQEPKLLKPSTSGNLKLEHAALSDQYLVLLTKREFLLYDHREGCFIGKKDWTDSTGSWNSACIAITETKTHVWIAVGRSQSQQQNTAKSDSIRMYQSIIAGNPSVIQNLDASFQSSVFNSDHPKRISFSLDGTRLVCVTHQNRVLAWALSDNAQPTHSAFKIEKNYKTVKSAARCNFKPSLTSF